MRLKSLTLASCLALQAILTGLTTPAQAEDGMAIQPLYIIDMESGDALPDGWTGIWYKDSGPELVAARDVSIKRSGKASLRIELHGSKGMGRRLLSKRVAPTKRTQGTKTP